jgi:hypothetical protein
MSVYLLIAKANNYAFTDWLEAVRRTHDGGVYPESWRVKSRKIEIGDEVYLLKQGDSPKGVVAHGWITRGSYNHFKNRDGSGGPSPRVDVNFDVVLGPTDEPLAWPLPNRGYDGKFRGPFSSGVRLADELVAEMARLWTQHVLHQARPSAKLMPSATGSRMLVSDCGDPGRGLSK